MIELEQLTKVYPASSGDVTVLDRLDLVVPTGEIAAVVGPSGAGKSTLAQCISLLEHPTSGRVVVNGEQLSQLTARNLRIARRRIGTIFQSDGLLSRRTAAQNVALPLEYRGVEPKAIRRRVAELLERVGLADKAHDHPHQLSGGQRQRVGIARALALKPSVLLADEATSGLDPDSTASIISLLKELRDELDLSILFITHEMDTVLRIADSAARLDHGRVVESGRVLDLLRNVDSPLGAALLPWKALDATPQAWRLAYTRPDVPADWLERLGRRTTGAVHLLGAAVETIDGQPVGHVTAGIHGIGDREFTELVGEFGIAARPLSGSLPEAVPA